MTQPAHFPDPERVKQRVAKMEEICKRWDALIVVTDSMIAELEEQIRHQPNEIYRLKRAKQLLNLDIDKPEEIASNVE